MRFYAFLILALLISATTFAQNTDKKSKSKLPPKARFFIDGKEADILVAKLLTFDNYASFGLTGVTPSDFAKNRLSDKPKTIRVTLKPGSKLMTLAGLFERYNVPEANQQIIKVNGDLLIIRDNFLANETRIDKVEISTDNLGNGFINIIIKDLLNPKNTG